MDLYVLASSIMIGLSVYCLIVVSFIFHYGIQKTDWAANKKKRIFNTGLGAWVFWIILLSVLTISGFLKDFSSFPPRPGIMFIPFIAITFFVFTQTAKEMVEHIPSKWLVVAQSFRVIVEIALWLLFLDGTCPEQMTFEGYNFDILAGLTAPVVAYFCFVKNKWSKSVAILWNIVSLSLLTTIVTISFLSMPHQFRTFMNEPANTMITEFPIVYLPVILVFAAYTLHIFSLRQLLSSSK